MDTKQLKRIADAIEEILRLVKKDNSKKGDIFLNCRSCKTLIRTDWYSRFDKRYCADCF